MRTQRGNQWTNLLKWFVIEAEAGWSGWNVNNTQAYWKEKRFYMKITKRKRSKVEQRDEKTTFMTENGPLISQSKMIMMTMCEPTYTSFLCVLPCKILFFLHFEVICRFYFITPGVHAHKPEFYIPNRFAQWKYIQIKLYLRRQ